MRAAHAFFAWVPVSRGFSNIAIGETLSILTSTVKKILTSAYSKLHAANRAQATCKYESRYGGDGKNHA